MRRLATIMFTDIVGYSAMMERDERGTLELLRLHNEILHAQIEKFGGKTVKTIGDAFLIDFNSVVECVECAFAILEAVGQFNQTREPNQTKLQLRIGVHVGDVIFQENDVFGDGVNVAQRIQTQAEPGSICISEEVYKLIEKKVPIHFRLIGEKKLKNIQRPMRVYVSGHPGVPAAASKPPGGGSNALAILAGVGLGLILVGGILYYYYYARPKPQEQAASIPTAPVAAAATNAPAPPVKTVPQKPEQAALDEHIKQDLLKDLSLSPSEALAVGAIQKKLVATEQGRFRVEADAAVSQTQDLFVPYEASRALKDLGYDADTYKRALAEAQRLSVDLAETAPKDEPPALVRRTTGKGYEQVFPVEFTAAPDGEKWVFTPIRLRPSEQKTEAFKGQPMSAFAPGTLVAGSEPAMQALGSYIQARESFSARVLVKQNQMKAKREEEVATRKAQELADLRKGFAVGEMYEGSMDKGGAIYQVLFMVVENRNDGQDVAATVALTGEPGIIKQLRGRIETAEKDGKTHVTAALTSVANTGVDAKSGIPEFFEKGKSLKVVFQSNGDRLEGSGGVYSFQLSKSKD